MKNYLAYLNEEPFNTLRDCVNSLGINAYVVGGYVRDLLLGIPSHDIDVVVEGSGIRFAEEYQRRVGGELKVYESYGTAAVGEVEFVGARKESYQRGSRNPIVEEGTLTDDLTRRDFTINAMAISIKDGTLIDLFNGLRDLQNGIIDTPIEPKTTFTDDPLRMLRAVRFSTKLGFRVSDRVLQAITEAHQDIKIIVGERIWTELEKIMSYPLAANGFFLLHDVGLLGEIIPELEVLAEQDDNRHKNNLIHSLQVLGNVVSSGSLSIPLRWAALFHDVGKGPTKRQTDGGWTFYGHDVVGSEMIPSIFRRLKAPLELADYVALLTKLHMRPQIIANTEVTDSAIRRLANEVGPWLGDLLVLSESDITTKNLEKKQKFLESYQEVRKKMQDLAERDYIREFKPVITGFDIMQIFGLGPGEEVGEIKMIVKEAILEGTLKNERETLIDFLHQLKDKGKPYR